MRSFYNEGFLFCYYKIDIDKLDVYKYLFSYITRSVLIIVMFLCFGNLFFFSDSRNRLNFNYLMFVVLIFEFKTYVTQ